MRKFPKRKSTGAKLAKEALEGARRLRRMHDLVGKQVKFTRMPQRLRTLIQGDTGTVVSTKGRNTTVRVGTALHNINSQYLEEVR